MVLTVAPTAHRPLHEVSPAELRVGDRLISAIGNPGHIINLVLEHKTPDGREEGWIEIDWDNGRCSFGPMVLDGVPWLTKNILYVGRKEEQ